MPRITRALALTGGLLCTACGGAKVRPPSDAGAPSAAVDSSSNPSTNPDAAAGGGRYRAVSLTITATVGGRSYRASGPGACLHTDDAEIYQAPAAMWSARFDAVSGDVRDLNLNLWQLKRGGPAQLTLALTVGDATHEIATLQHPGAPLRGKGTGEVRRHDPAGTLVVDGADSAGTPMHVEVECERFAVPVGQGG
jgi:hypothetical protein